MYARISLDQDGEGLGVKRQVEDCEALAASLGWTVAEVYIDNDVSAYSGTKRPAYGQMMADIEDGHRDGVLIYHPDRLSRRPIEIERFLETLQTAGVNQVRFVASGGLDIETGDGVFTLRVLGIAAAHESEAKARRIKRKNDERAAAGLPHVSGTRPFGYEADFITVVEDEAAVLREVVERFLAGESQRSLCSWLEEQGIRTSAEGPWRTSQLATTLKNPRYAGLLVHRGEIVGPGVWEPIITDDQRNRVLAVFDGRKSTGRRTPRTSLLSGLVRCSKCENLLYSASRKNKNGSRTRRYVCQSGPDHGGCGKLTVVAEPLEELVTAAVLFRLDTPDLAGALAGKAEADDEASKLVGLISEDRARLDELATMYASAQIDGREWLTAKQPITERIREYERRVGRLTRTDALGGLAGNGEALAVEWPDLDLSRQVAIVKAVLDHVLIGPGSGGARTLDPARVDLVWRL